MERAKAFIIKRSFLYRDWNKVSSDSWLDLVQAVSKRKSQETKPGKSCKSFQERTKNEQERKNYDEPSNHYTWVMIALKLIEKNEVSTREKLLG